MESNEVNRPPEPPPLEQNVAEQLADWLQGWSDWIKADLGQMSGSFAYTEYQKTNIESSRRLAAELTSFASLIRECYDLSPYDVPPYKADSR